jgi:hypothetical protein
MPTIQDANTKITSFPNKFVSPFGNEAITPFYSSVPLKSPVEGCLECVVCGSVVQREQITFRDPELTTLTLQVPPPPAKTPALATSLPYQEVEFSVVVHNSSDTDRVDVIAFNTFGGATLIEANYPYVDGGFNLGTIASNSSVTLVYKTQMPWNMVADVVDITSIPDFGDYTSTVSLPFEPTIIFTPPIPTGIFGTYQWNNLSYWFNLDGTLANRIPNASDNVITQNASFPIGTTTQTSVAVKNMLMEVSPGKLSRLNRFFGSVICSENFYMMGIDLTPSTLFTYSIVAVETLSAQNVFLYGASTIGNCISCSGFVSTCSGNFEFKDKSSVLGGVYNGNFTLRDKSYIYYPNETTLNGNLDVYYPVDLPLNQITVTGTTTYHGY